MALVAAGFNGKGSNMGEGENINQNNCLVSYFFNVKKSAQGGQHTIFLWVLGG